MAREPDPDSGREDPPAPGESLREVWRSVNRWLEERSLIIRWGARAGVFGAGAFFLNRLGAATDVLSSLIPTLTVEQQLLSAVLGVVVIQTVIQRQRLLRIQSELSAVGEHTEPRPDGGGRGPQPRDDQGQFKPKEEGGSTGGGAIGGAILGGALGSSFGPGGTLAGAVLGALVGDSIEKNEAGEE